MPRLIQYIVFQRNAMSQLLLLVIAGLNVITLSYGKFIID